MNKKQIVLLVCGIAAPVFYVAAVVIGGIITPGYSHLAHDISGLIAADAPKKAVLDPLFITYNILLGGFGVGLLTAFRERGGAVGKAGAVILIVIGILGLILTIFFPRDAIGAEQTFAGRMHIIFAGLMSLGTMAAIPLVGLHLRNAMRLRGHARYSFITLAVVIISGIWAVQAAATGSELLGLAERITIGAFILWIFIIALKIRASLSETTMQA